MEKFGFFIDTELQYSKNGRIDLVYLYYKNPDEPKLYFVELKTKGDDRLWDNTCNSAVSKENICEQLNKYKDFINSYETKIIDYYKTLYKIKKDLGLVPSDVAENVKIEKPVLLFGFICVTIYMIYLYIVEINTNVYRYVIYLIVFGI